MCYIISQGMRKARQDRDMPPFIQSAKKREAAAKAARKGEGYEPEPEDKYVAHGVEHPQLQIVVADGSTELMYWGLVPSYARNRTEGKIYWERNLMVARGETMFELPSYRDAARTGRCLLPLTGYFEHHHAGGKKIPYLIRRRDQKIFFVGAICSIWTAPETGKTIKTFAQITTPANELAAKVHNKPKHGESRMPLIIEETDLQTWLHGSPEEVLQLIRANTTAELEAFPVSPLLGNAALGNCEEALQQKIYTGISNFFY